MPPPRMRTRKRTLLPRMFLLLLAYSGGGAIVNVAVAWGCALGNIRPTKVTLLDSDVGNALWHRMARDEWPEFPTDWNSRASSVTPVHSYVSMQRFSLGTQSEVMQIAEGQSFWVVNRATCGLPLPGLQGENSFTTVPTNSSEYSQSFRFSSKIRQLIPYGPLWPGFAINTVFYAGLLWLGIRGPLTLRRYVRQKHGRCLACAYDLRGSASENCPECGKLVTK